MVENIAVLMTNSTLTWSSAESNLSEVMFNRSQTLPEIFIETPSTLRQISKGFDTQKTVQQRLMNSRSEWSTSWPTRFFISTTFGQLAWGCCLGESQSKNGVRITSICHASQPPSSPNPRLDQPPYRVDIMSYIEPRWQHMVYMSFTSMNFDVSYLKEGGGVLGGQKITFDWRTFAGTHTLTSP